jgi:acetylornithine/succinyldiaminopimelate/putrescine aminotransferase
MYVLGPGTHGCTVGGHPVSFAAALAMLNMFDKEDVVAGVVSKGTAMMEAFAAAGVPARGLGLLIGVPVSDGASGVAAMQGAGYLIGLAGPKVVRCAIIDCVPCNAFGRRSCTGSVHHGYGRIN